MILRPIQPILSKLATKCPIVTVVGPRQSRKTVPVQAVFAGKPYANLEAPDFRRFAEDDRGQGIFQPRPDTQDALFPRQRGN